MFLCAYRGFCPQKELITKSENKRRGSETNMQRRNVVFAAIAAIVLIASTYFFVVNYVYVNPSQQTLKVFCATRLLFPLETVEADFEA